ncbi:MoaD/ThiS family protein [Leucobacter tenebrionis]|uniref:MoaD/ThiS family protein n=1 Tax=Leucobacter tenebrionis TaxID=2873270 RepID=UPI001CA64B66|nr:MoaD/ThiS family protein [Leucobacter tenebrionis]QZY52824.1 MoaD/ThiS family protein [Leucobacter tenebrionis]
MTGITVRYFAAAADAAGTAQEEVLLSAPATLDALRAELADRHGAAMLRVLRSGSFLVDGEVRRDGGEIGAGPGGTVVDVLPPFAGG